MKGDIEGIIEVKDIIEEKIERIKEDRSVMRNLRRSMEERIDNLRSEVK